MESISEKLLRTGTAGLRVDILVDREGGWYGTFKVCFMSYVDLYQPVFG